MVDFRRWITALAVLALFVGLASAQVSGPGTGAGPLVCTATVAVPPLLRSEGMTELIGDIVITCTGGQSLLAGSAIPTANFTVSLGTNVTSRIIGSSGISEALLLIDEPGTFPALPALVPGYGPAAAQTACSPISTIGAGSGGCVQFAQMSANGLPIPSSSATSLTAPANVFFGVVSGNQVTFNGVPILPPISSSTTRVFRITNVRANVSGLGGGGLPGTTQLLASVAISGSTSVPVNNPTVIAGFVQQGLSTTVRNAGNSSNLSGSGAGFLQCNSANTAGVATLQFSENFGTAFKTRVAPTATYNGQAGTNAINQNIPGTIYNSESGFIFPGVTSTITTGGITFAGTLPGLADYGTRLKAVFNNVPAGVRLFVSVTNLASGTTSATTTQPAPTATTSFAQLVAGEAIPDGNGTVPIVNPTASANSNATALAEIPIVNGSGTAVWEVVNTNPAALETLNFGVWTSYSANTANNTPPVGTATVNMSFAPTPPTAFSASAGAQASSSLPIPRFADTSTAKNLLVINICQTLLLFPYVTNQAGFDTGLAIANTTQDPIGTSAQAGTCNLTFYDGTGKTPAVTTPSIAAGTVYTNLASVVASGFQGYMFAQCNFQAAHGFAFISDLGARNLAMGYLALVVNNGAVTRNNAPAGESLGN
jgi:hypothetical protein